MTLANDAAIGPGRVLLVSAPWPLFNRPSLPLGALKGYLKRHHPHLTVDACHLFLTFARALGYDRYEYVSRRVWRAEAVFSALLFPERAHLAEALYASTLRRRTSAGRTVATDFGEMIREAERVSERWLATIDWSALDLVGFSVSFCQVTASLYLISRIKRRRPTLPVVVGGSAFSAERTIGWLKSVCEVDFLVIGEGERPLSALIRDLQTPPPQRLPASLPASVLHADAGPRDATHRFDQVERLARLPVPDYDDYFHLLRQFPLEERFFPTLPIEASRGCWWHRQDRSRRFKGCAFCNLNLQWRGYRTKSPRQVVKEVAQLVDRHEVLTLAFADNAFPIKHAAAIFKELRGLGMDLSIFTELRAKTPASVFRTMQQAGVETVQIGIEALSSRLLGKMNKGALAIDNLNMMKQCEGQGISNASNLMLHFPSSDATDVEETLAVLDFARWYRPLKSVSFWLGRESPVSASPKRFHLCSTFNHPHLAKLFPRALAAQMRFLIQGYRGDRTFQRRLWRPVEAKIRQWNRDYAAMQRQTQGKPALCFREGREFLIIDQHFPEQPTVKHRLRGVSAAIYRYCETPRSFDKIAGTALSHRPQAIRAFLESMIEKRLMFAEQDLYLSLAIRQGK